MKNKMLGFTLSEVLVTLGIIGVVSALTIPSLMNKWQRDTYATQAKQTYSMLSQALTQYKTDKMALSMSEAGIRSQESFGEFLKTYLRVVQDCGKTSTDCFASDYKKMNGTALDIIKASSATNSVLLAGGQSLGWIYSVSGSRIVGMLVDINGQQGPNIQGRDLFEFFVYDSGFVDDYYTSAPMPISNRETEFNSYCKAGGSTNFHGCVGHLINNNWEMDY